MAGAPAQIGPGARGAVGLPGWMASLARYRSLILPVGFVSMLAVVVVPLPPFVMDALIAGNFALAVVTLMTTIAMREPLDFSVFPSLLLATTLYRLVLNVASTRLILSADATTPEEALSVAGEVIRAFGSFVAGDSIVVGSVIFVILIIVQFVVITKGATRISEVAARFTLDAMPGKQMAIDADLNAGVINEAEARKRRERIAQEADFFGAMDGASKFVRGDAIAGILITIINVAGGFAIGWLDKGWDPAQTARTFTILTIGDGLTAQIPALVISIASALIVTRSGSKEDLGTEFTGQLTSQPTGLAITAVFLLGLGFTGLPILPLTAGAAALGGLAWALRRTQARAAAGERERAAGVTAKATREPPTPESLLKLDTIELEVGFGLVGLVDAGRGGDLLERIAAIRRHLAAEMGFVLPAVRIRDNLQLGGDEYRVRIKGAVVAVGSAQLGKLLAIDPGIATGPIEGVLTKEPAFGLEARWIEPSLRAQAETRNYTVVDAASVVATHLTEIIRRHAAELLTREEVSNLIAQLKSRTPKLVEEVVGETVKTADLHRVLQNLLRERVPIRDLETVLETLADWMSRTKDVDVLTEYVRNALRRAICQQFAALTPEGTLRLVCVALDPSLEDVVAQYIDRSATGTSISVPAAVSARVCEAIASSAAKVTQAGHQPVVLASPTVRAAIRQIIEAKLPGTAVMGYNEVAQGVEAESVAVVSLNAAPGAPAAGSVSASAREPAAAA